MEQSRDFIPSDELDRSYERATNRSFSGSSGGAERPMEASMPPVREEVSCPACQAQNNTNQRFCGFCGEHLVGAAVAARHDGSLPPPPTFELRSPFADREDVDWLRTKSMLSILREPEPQPSGAGKYFVVIVLMALGCGFLYWQWAAGSDRKPGQPPLQQAQTPGQDQSTETARGDQRPPTTGSEAAPASTSGSQADKNEGANNKAGGKVPQTGHTSATGVTQAANVEHLPVGRFLAGKNGAKELAIAEGYLAPARGRRDPHHASKWLRKAIAKRNGEALVVLADLYVHGDGVPKSCRQAHSLLVTAAKKKVPEASRKLRSLERSGCH